MLKYTILVSVLLAISIPKGWAQRNLEELKKLGKLQITRLAVMDMQDSFEATRNNFDLSAYEVSVWTNSEELIVYFKLPNVVYLPQNTRVYGNLEGDVLNKSFSMAILANPPDYEGPILFYPTYWGADVLFNIEVVVDGINNAHGEGSFSIDQFDGQMEIRELENYYDVKIRYATSISYFKIDKKSGKLYEERSRNTAAMPPLSNNYVEIKE